MKDCTHWEGHLWSDGRENEFGGTGPGQVIVKGDQRSMLVHCTRYGCDEIGYLIWTE